MTLVVLFDAQSAGKRRVFAALLEANTEDGGSRMSFLLCAEASSHLKCY